jgi:hypothetical protein
MQAYECTVNVSAFLRLGYSHSGNPPAIGSIERLAVNEFADSSEPRHSVLVRASSPEALPTFGSMVPLSMDAYVFAFKLAMAKAVEKQDSAMTDNFKKAARSFRVRFCLLRSDDDAELHKWKACSM